MSHFICDGGIPVNQQSLLICVIYIFRRKHGEVVPFFRVAKERHQESKSGGVQQVAIPPNNPLNIRKTATLTHRQFCFGFPILASLVKGLFHMTGF